ncbi:hypothetical protein HRG84_13590 [Flavisolibacter sp. BT320]|nr:hypothetical protein [Flavisolibacter longurius]
MFNNISWQGYWITIALLSAGYYLIIYLLYFRKDFSIEWKKGTAPKIESPFRSLNSDSGAIQPITIEQPTLFDSSGEFQPPAKNTIESTVYVCMDEVNAYLEEARRSKCVKEEMLFALNTILRKYPTVADSEYKESVTNVIVNQCEYNCSVHLSAEDVVRMWVDW